MTPASDITRRSWLACRTRTLARWFLAAACGAVLLAPACGVAQQTFNNQASLINWWYSAAFGTGFYQIGPAIATVVRFPVSYHLQEMQGDRTGIKAIVPVTLAAYHLNFNDIGDFDIHRDVAAASVSPGLEWEVTMSDAWRLKPFAQGGIGREFGDVTQTAYLYTSGIKSLYRFSGTDYRVSLGNALLVAGYRIRDTDEKQNIASFQFGLNTETPWSFDLWDRNMYFNAHAIATVYYSKLAFASATPGEQAVRQEYQVGFSLRTPKPMSVLGFGADTIGLGFRFASNVRGISLVTEFPF